MPSVYPLPHSHIMIPSCCLAELLLASHLVFPGCREKVTPLRAAYCKGKHMWSGHPLKVCTRAAHLHSHRPAVRRCGRVKRLSRTYALRMHLFRLYHSTGLWISIRGTGRAASHHQHTDDVRGGMARAAHECGAARTGTMPQGGERRVPGGRGAAGVRGGAVTAVHEAAVGGAAVLLRVRRTRPVRVHSGQPGDGAARSLSQRHPASHRLEVRLSRTSPAPRSLGSCDCFTTVSRCGRVGASTGLSNNEMAEPRLHAWVQQRQPPRSKPN
jgi:hypothetical protein